MNRKAWIAAAGWLLLLMLMLWRYRTHTTPPVPLAPMSAPAVAVSTPTVTLEAPKPPPPVEQKPRVKVPAPALPSSPLATGPTAPPPIELHKELIPKDITIVRCYYDQEVLAPGVTIGFDVNGSGFTREFEKMIKVNPGAKFLKVKNFRLVTANQIHGEMEIGADAATELVYPQVLIKNLPVFRAPDPFAVIRKGEVLTIVFINMESNGRAGRFRVFTNLDNDLYKDFHVMASTPGLQITDIEPHLPFVVDGTLRIGSGVPQGTYGIAVTLGSKRIFTRENIIRIVRPNLGATGLIHSVVPVEPFHRPGDTLQLYLQGTGLSPDNVPVLTARVDGYDMGQASFTYVSASQIRFTFGIPVKTPPGSYGVTVLGQNATTLFEKKDIFTIVPPNWVAGFQINPSVSSGQKAVLRLIGRDFSADFAKSLTIETDEPGLHLSSLQWVDASTLAGEISVDAAVAPGDYLLTLTSNGKTLKPEFGSLIKVNPK